MDYKEKYEQALERARQFSEKPYLEDSAGIVEYIFPELKKSKDERIELLNYLYDVHDDDEERARWIAWLEKQGEKKVSYIDMSLVDAVRFCVADNLAHKSTDDNGNTIGFGVYIDDTTAQKLTNELSDIFQKSIEWSEDDKTRLDEIVTHLKGMVSVSDIDFLKSLKGRVLPQPQQEWSEEDEQLYNDLSDTYFYNDEEYPEETYKRMLKRVLDWMDKRAKLLRPKQKWSEEDEGMRINLIQGFEMMKDGASSDTVKALYDKKIDWLKSLRPLKLSNVERIGKNWKPSDEQMETLEKAILYIESGKSNFKGSGRVLETLLEQLKKLRKE